MIVALIGLVISFWAYVIAFPHPHQRRFDIYLALLALHLAAAIAYWLMGFESAMDAYMYYHDPLNFIARDPFQNGTYFIVHVEQRIKSILGGSFLDHFLFFQCFGMVGIALIARTFNEIADSLDLAVPLHVYALLFLPGLHFWSVAIGKDGPMIMAVALSIWAILRLEKRFFAMFVALLIMALIRPHVAAFAVFGIVASVFFARQIGVLAKLLLGPIAIVGLTYAVFRAQENLGVGTGVEAVSEFIEGQQELGAEFGSGANIQSLPYPMKVFTLLFRPLFIDAEGMMAQLASIENVVLMYVFGYITYNWRIVIRLFRSVGLITYCVTFSSVLIMMLAFVNYNLGLGQRQKMMAIPAVVMIYGAIFLYKRFLANVALAVPDGPVEEPDYASVAKA